MDEFGNDGFGRILRSRSAMTGSVGAYFDKWWLDMSLIWAGTTRETYKSTYDAWLSDEELRALPFPPSIDQIRLFYARLSATPPTLFRIHCLLRSAFQVAVDEGVISRNPTRYKGAPPRPKSKDVRPLDPDEERDLIAYVKGNAQWEALVMLALDSGAREGELFGLQARDFDLGLRTVNFTRTVDTIRGQPICKNHLKNPASRRCITLSRQTVDLLSPLVSGATNSHEHLFRDSAGNMWTRHRFYRGWLALLRAAGISKHHFHGCRHTAATRLLRAGCSVIAVSKRLGHARPSITLDIYGGYLPSDQNALADQFERQLEAYGVREGATKAKGMALNLALAENDALLSEAIASIKKPAEVNAFAGL